MSKVIVFRGKAGVGKTTISNELGKKLNIPVIKKDDIYDSVVCYIHNHEIRNKACHEILFKIIDTNITNGIDLIVDAGFNSPHEVKHFKSWLSNKNADFISFLCVCSDEEILEERIKNNNYDPNSDELNNNLYNQALKNEIILDTVDSVNVLMEKVIDEIKIK